MKTLYKSIGIALIVVLSIFTITCQQNPMGPESTAIQTIQPVPIQSDQAAGLAKGVMSHQRYIPAHIGGILGGAQTDYNFTYIPRYTLQEDLYMYFKLTLVDDPEDPLYGTLIYTLHSRDYAETQNISFRDDAHSFLYLNKEWVDLENIEDGDIGIYNLDDPSEQFTAEEVWRFYRVEVPHFSRWAWGILE